MPDTQKALSLVPSIEKGRREEWREGGQEREKEHPGFGTLAPIASSSSEEELSQASKSQKASSLGKPPVLAIPLSPFPEDRPFSACPLSLLSHWYLWAPDQEVSKGLLNSGLCIPEMRSKLAKEAMEGQLVRQLSGDQRSTHGINDYILEKRYRHPDLDLHLSVRRFRLKEPLRGLA